MIKELHRYHPILQNDYLKKYQYFMNSSVRQFFMYSVITYNPKSYFPLYDREECYYRVRDDICELKKRINRNLFPQERHSNLKFIFTIEETPHYHFNMLMTEPDVNLIRNKYTENFNFTKVKTEIERQLFKFRRFKYFRIKKTFSDDLTYLKKYITKEINERNNHFCLDYENSDFLRYEDEITHLRLRTRVRNDTPNIQRIP